jgi:uncharacterized protein (AIM24 family)
MATFEIVEQEGMRFVKIGIDKETVQAESGALCAMSGNVTMDVKLPSVGRILKSYASEEAHIRPTYTGTGTILLESSFGGFHVVDLKGETWILESGSYWASDASLDLSAIRERVWTSLWTGEGVIDWQTKVSGHGKVVVRTQGPVEELNLMRGERYVANGKYVVGRSAEVAYSLRRPARSLLATYASGEGYCRVYDGPGRLLVSSIPYWRYRLFGQRQDNQLGHMLAG